MKKRSIIFLVIIILLSAIGYYGYRTFTIHYDKLGESSFYKDSNIELKVVLTFANIPISYVGNTYAVGCKSQNTQDFPEWKFDNIEKGWNRIPPAYLGNGIGSDKHKVLNSLVNEAKKLYLVKDKMTVVILRSVDTPSVYVSFDGCRTFTNWTLKENNLPTDLIVESTPEFEKCVEQHKKDQEMGLTSYGNCSVLKFAGPNSPVYQDIIAKDQGYAAFKITSSAFRNGKSISVETEDFGKTWQNIVNN